MKVKTAAIVTLNEPGAWSKPGRRMVAAWLRTQAAYLVRYGEEYTDTGKAVARYQYMPRSFANPRPNRSKKR